MDGVFSAECTAEERAPSKFVDVTIDDVGAAAGASKREGTIEVVEIGAAESAGNFAVRFAAPELVVPKAGSATVELIPKSSACVLESMADKHGVLIIPHNNRIELRFITLAPNI